MFSIFDEGYDIGDVLFVAGLLVLCVLVDAGLVFAGDRFKLDWDLFDWHADELELEVAGAADD